jgi:hypothetical protein
MKTYKQVIPVFFLFASVFCSAQTGQKKMSNFFADERPVEVNLSTDIKKLARDKKAVNSVDASFSCIFPDSSVIADSVKLSQRGNFRKEECYLASLMIRFNAKPANKFAPFKKLKMVAGCGKSRTEEQNLFKEYLVYKIYNLLTEFSFRVRLMNVTYTDTKGKIKPYSQYAFVLEDIDDLAKRNKCREKELIRYNTENTDRSQTTLVSVFQYMIGNTDWSVPYYHNIKLVVPKKDTNAFPIVIAYDFDVSGLVNPPYATPDPGLGIESVTERVYRGFPRSMEELRVVIDLFRQKENEILSLINNFNLLDQRYKNDMINYLGDFFSVIKDDAEVKNIFITNARRK